MTAQPKNVVLLLFAVGVIGLSWAGTLAILRPSSPPRPFVTSLQEAIAYYGGCTEFKQAMQEVDRMHDAVRADLAKSLAAEDGIHETREDMAVRRAERALNDAKVEAACRDYQSSLTEGK